MQRVFAIGDIHGCSKTFKKLLLEKIQIRKSDKIYCIGDYIDRGKDSKGVIDFIFELRKKGYHIHTLRGNHEQMMLNSEKNEESFEHWYTNGGKATLNSFEVDLFSEMPEVYKRFFRNTKYCITTRKYIFVHAGLNFDKDYLYEDKDAMLWSRDFPSNQPVLQSQILIHGHTPKSLDIILSQHGNCFNIDGGCVFKEHSHLGKLVALNVTERKFISVNNCE